MWIFGLAPILVVLAMVVAEIAGRVVDAVAQMRYATVETTDNRRRVRHTT